MVKWQRAAKKAIAKKIINKVEKKIHQKDWKKNPPRRNARVGNQVSAVAAAPSAFGFKSKYQGPNFNRGKAFRITNTEYLEDIPGSVGFSATTYNINPGLADSFPWLGQLGMLFEQYVIRKMVFTFTPFVGSSTAGTLMMATQFDALDTEFGSKEEMLSYEGSRTSNVWVAMNHPVAAKGPKAFKRYFTRAGTPPSGSDIRLYDYGNFVYATQGQTSTATLGELRVHYVVDFYVPKILQAEAVGNFLNTSTTGEAPTLWNTNPVELYKSLPIAKYIDNTISPGQMISYYKMLVNGIQFARTGYHLANVFITRVSGTGTFSGMPGKSYVNCAAVGTPGEGVSTVDYGGMFNVLASIAGAYIVWSVGSSGTLTVGSNVKVSAAPFQAFGAWYLNCPIEKSYWTAEGRDALLRKAKHDKVPQVFIERIERLKVWDIQELLEHLGHAQLFSTNERKLETKENIVYRSSGTKFIMSSGADDEDGDAPVIVRGRPLTKEPPSSRSQSAT